MLRLWSKKKGEKIRGEWKRREKEFASLRNPSNLFRKGELSNLTMLLVNIRRDVKGEGESKEKETSGAKKRRGIGMDRVFKIAQGTTQ